MGLFRSRAEGIDPSLAISPTFTYGGRAPRPDGLPAQCTAELNPQPQIVGSASSVDVGGTGVAGAISRAFQRQQRSSRYDRMLRGSTTARGTMGTRPTSGSVASRTPVGQVPMSQGYAGGAGSAGGARQGNSRAAGRGQGPWPPRATGNSPETQFGALMRELREEIADLTQGLSDSGPRRISGGGGDAWTQGIAGNRGQRGQQGEHGQRGPGANPWVPPARTDGFWGIGNLRDLQNAARTNEEQAWAEVAHQREQQMWNGPGGGGLWGQR